LMEANFDAKQIDVDRFIPHIMTYRPSTNSIADGLDPADGALEKDDSGEEEDDSYTQKKNVRCERPPGVVTGGRPSVPPGTRGTPGHRADLD
jgi:hypothetical protein